MENLLIWKFLLDWRRGTEANPDPNGGLSLRAESSAKQDI